MNNDKKDKKIPNEKIFNKSDIYNLCYAEFLTGSLNDYSFPNEEVNCKYNELSKESKEKLEKLIEVTVKKFKDNFDYIEKIDTTKDLSDLHKAQQALLEKILPEFSRYIEN